jgi:predicted TIM-barrel fold metal-dependent hydrolase
LGTKYFGIQPLVLAVYSTRLENRSFNLIRYVDSHTHVGISDMPEHCSQYMRRLGLDSNVWPPAKKMRELFSNDSVECLKVVLIPSYPCANNLKVEGVYQQAEYAKDMRDFYYLFGGVNPTPEFDIRSELEQQYSKLEIVGVKLHPVHHCFKPNDYLEKSNSQLLRVYEFAEDHDLPVMFHTGTSVGVGSRNKFGDPIYIDDVAVDFPRLKIIISHAGRPIWFQTAFTLCRIHENIYLELSGIPPKRLKEYLPRLAELSSKAIYGSDYPNFRGQTPYTTAQEFAEAVEGNSDILRDNILKLLK